MDTGLVTTDWLASQLDAPDLTVLDCTVWLRSGSDGYTVESGRNNWHQGHIPGAGFADLTAELCDPANRLRFALPSPEAFCSAMGRLGVGDTSRVVLYDDNQSMWAARVWWMLRWVGFDSAALLDGGLQAWRAEGRPLQPGPVDQTPAQLTPKPRPRVIADKAEVADAVDDASVCLIDALPGPVYRGEVAAYRRPGHIPSATNTPATSLIDSATGRFRPLDELRDQFGADHTMRTITYCGGGIAASCDAFVLSMLGHHDIAVYTASLQEWAVDPTLPLTTEP